MAVGVLLLPPPTYHVAVEYGEPNVAVAATSDAHTDVVECGAHHCSRHILCGVCIQHNDGLGLKQRVDHPVRARVVVCLAAGVVCSYMEATAYCPATSGHTSLLEELSTCASRHIRSPGSE